MSRMLGLPRLRWDRQPRHNGHKEYCLHINFFQSFPKKRLAKMLG